MNDFGKMSSEFNLCVCFGDILRQMLIIVIYK